MIKRVERDILYNIRARKGFKLTKGKKVDTILSRNVRGKNSKRYLIRRIMKKISEKRKKWIERTVANDRSYKWLLYNRFFMYLLLVASQVLTFAGLGFLCVYYTPIGAFLQIVLTAVSILTSLYIFNTNEHSSVKMSWLLLIFIIPVVGVPAYFLYGEGKPTWRMRKKAEKARRENLEKIKAFYGERELPIAKTRGETLERYLQNKVGYPAFHDGSVTYFESGEKMFPAMLDALRSAKKYILLEYFIIEHGKMWGEILKILLQKAGEGVKIRIIYDDFGCMMTLPPDYEKYLQSLHENIRCMSFNQVVPIFAVRMNNRDHRKILVVDGKIGFTGGINLADEYIAEKRRFGYWKDTGVKITGNAVRNFVDIFFYMWNAFRKDKEDIAKYLPKESLEEEISGFCVQPYDDSPLDKQSVGEGVYLDMITRSTRYLYIFTPYLILTEVMRDAICQACARGVDVRLVIPGIPDKKTAYRITRRHADDLQKAGVKVYTYTPGFIHAKSMVCDDEYAVVGTINLDYRSLYLHFENAVYFSGCQAVLDLKKDCEQTFAVSAPYTGRKKRSKIVGRLIDAVLRLVENLF